MRSEWTTAFDANGGGGLPITYTSRPYPSGGSSYPLELYLAVDKCEGLGRGFYFYDAGEHALVPIYVRATEFEALLKSAAFAMGESGVPQILITIAARFGRVSWKYSSIAYSLILKDVGVLMQTFYLMATAMGLGGCAIGSINIDLFARMTGIDFYVEGPVGQFAIGRGGEFRLQARERPPAVNLEFALYQDHRARALEPGEGSRSKYPTALSLCFPISANMAPWGSAQRATLPPPGMSVGPSRILPRSALTRSAAAPTSATLK